MRNRSGQRTAQALSRLVGSDGFLVMAAMLLPRCFGVGSNLAWRVRIRFVIGHHYLLADNRLMRTGMPLLSVVTAFHNEELLSFSSVPIQAIGMMAAGLALLTLGMLTGVLAGTAIGHTVAGWMWVLLGVLAVGAAQMTALTVLGAYLWRTFDEARRRPSYLIEKVAGAHHPDQRGAA